MLTVVTRYARIAAGMVLVMIAAPFMAVVVLPVVGLRVSSVSSASMVPTIVTGDVIVADPHARPRAGDVVLARVDGTTRVIAHRLAARTGDGGWRTKGDANPDWDSWVTPDDHIEGVMVGRPIPLIGWPRVLWSAGWAWRVVDLLILAAVLGLAWFALGGVARPDEDPEHADPEHAIEDWLRNRVLEGAGSR